MLLICSQSGEMAERLIAAVLKTVEDLRPPGVRISLSPPYKNLTSCKEIIFTRGFLCLICKTKKLLGFAVFTQRPAGQRSSLRNSNKCCSISDEAGCGCLLPYHIRTSDLPIRHRYKFQTMGWTWLPHDYTGWWLHGMMSYGFWNLTGRTPLLAFGKNWTACAGWIFLIFLILL